jgi:hypothetical protein
VAEGKGKEGNGGVRLVKCYGKTPLSNKYSNNGQELKTGPARARVFMGE